MKKDKDAFEWHLPASCPESPLLQALDFSLCFTTSCCMSGRLREIVILVCQEFLPGMLYT